MNLVAATLSIGRAGLVALSALALAGCAGSQQSAPPAGPEDPYGASTRQLHAGDRFAEEVDDGALSDAVRIAIDNDEAIDGEGVRISATDGIIELRGTVQHLMAKRRAVEQATYIRGVRGVVDLLEIEPARATDDEVELSIETMWTMDRVTEAAELGVSVQDGVATISGEVDSWAERSVADQTAAAVPGVVKIENQILVTGAGADRDDADIADEIRSRLAMDARIDAALLRVNVRDGTVKLSGPVGSLAEARLAKRLAEVIGVRTVDTSGLSVEWWARDSKRRVDRPVPPDTQIGAAIKRALELDPRVRGELDVTVRGGIVTLRGTVPTVAAVRAAERTARDVIGVISVIEELTVAPDRSVSDQAIAATIDRALVADPYLNSREIGVTVQEGNVYLTGNVETRFEKRHAERTIERVRGVTGINNGLFVQQTTGEAPGSDAAVRAAVRHQLTWNPFVSAAGIDVSVKDGVVTLKGKVVDYRAMNAALTAARRGGADRVVNELRVAGHAPSDVPVQPAPSSR